MINCLGIPGRVVPAVLADRYFGPVNVIVASILLTGIVQYAWIAANNVTGLWAWVAVYGFFAGADQALFLASAASFSPDPTKVGARIGMAFTVVSFACLSGPPIGGLLVEKSNGRYLKAQVFGGTVMICGGLILVAGRLARTGFRWKVRV